MLDHVQGPVNLGAARNDADIAYQVRLFIKTRRSHLFEADRGDRHRRD